MGILATILGTQNPLAQWTLANHGLLSSWGQGLAAGPTIEQGLSKAAQLGPAGQLIDQQYQKEQQDKAERETAIKQSAKDLAKFPDLMAAVASKAITPAEAYGEAWKRSAPGYGRFSLSPGETEYDANGTMVAAAPPGKGTTPSGYRWTSDGSKLEPVPGGPADPSSAQSLSPEALDLIATQYLAGDKTVVQGYARNATMRAQISNAIAEKANAAGMDGNAIAAQVSAYGGNVAAQRAAGTRAAQVGMAASEANQMADIALQASQKVPRGMFVPWNAAMNAVATGTSSPEMAQFVTATTSLVNAYARAVSPLGAPTDAMRQHAEAMLNTAQGPEAYAAVIAQMKKEMEAALNAPAEVSDRLKTNITGNAPLSGGGAYDPEVEQILKGVGL